MPDLALALLTALIRALKSRRYLVLENLALRHQLAVLAASDRRPRFRLADRLVWTCLRRLWDNWRGSLFLVQPATVVRWHREGFPRYWRRKSRRWPGCAPGVSRSRCGAQRETSSPHPRKVLRLLPPNANTSEPRQGLPTVAADSAARRRRDRRAARSRRTASPLRAARRLTRRALSSRLQGPALQRRAHCARTRACLLPCPGPCQVGSFSAVRRIYDSTDPDS